MNVNIRYFKVVSNKKQVVDPPEGFPSIIDISRFAHRGDGVALARAMGEHMRSSGLEIPAGVFYEKEPTK